MIEYKKEHYNRYINLRRIILKNKLTNVMTLHYVKLVYRSILLIAGIIIYILTHLKGEHFNLDEFSLRPETFLLLVVWIVYVVEMILRFFPSRHESMGCQKQFKRNYEPTGRKEIKNVPWWRTFICAAAWIALNMIFGILYMTDVFDSGILILISLAYGVCDMICILFFCPFHTWFLRHRCCTDCRIYNWDFAMMFTPFAFILGHWFTASLFIISMILLIRWEITYKARPERFSTNTNKCLDCAHCPEKLCKHKTQLKSYIKKNKDRLFK